MKINNMKNSSNMFMKKLMYILPVFVAVLCMISCENDIDNYDAPNGGITGTVFDAGTNEPIPLPVQGSNGVIVNLYEVGTDATKSVDFRAKQDGTYEHSKVFNCEYRVVVNGPFIDKCEGTVQVKGQTRFDLTATPYSRVNAEATVDADKKVTINYSAVPSKTEYTVKEISLMWNFAPGVDVNSSNYATKTISTTASGNFVFDLSKDNQFLNNHYKIAANGNKIYVRVAADVNGVINYSKIIELTVN